MPQTHQGKCIGFFQILYRNTHKSIARGTIDFELHFHTEYKDQNICVHNFFKEQ